MPWNKPGQDERTPPHNPWGNNNNGRKKSSPPDLDKIFIEFFQKIRALLMGKSTSPSPHPSSAQFSFGIGTVVVVAIIVWFASGFFIVNPAEEAVVLRFGKYTDTLQPGLHWVARFIESKTIIDVQKIYSFSLQGDFLTKSSDQDAPVNNAIDVKNTASDQSKNLVNIELNVMYRIDDPKAYLFSLDNPDDTIQQAASGALSEVVGSMKLDEVLTTGRELLASSVLTRTRQILANYHAGLDVTTVTLKRAQAPDQVREAFNDVNRAEQDRKTSINQAQAYASRVIPLANGDAARTLADADGYREKVVLNAKADVARYQALQKVFAQFPDITRERMYLETMQSILQRTPKVLVDANISGNMLYLPIDKLSSRETTPVKTADEGEQK